MSDIYVEQLEMQLRFAEEDAQKREKVAFEMGKEQGREDGIDELCETMKSHSNPMWHDWLDRIAEKLKEKKQ